MRQHHAACTQAAPPLAPCAAGQYMTQKKNRRYLGKGRSSRTYLSNFSRFSSLPIEAKKKKKKTISTYMGTQEEGQKVQRLNCRDHLQCRCIVTYYQGEQKGFLGYAL